MLLNPNKSKQSNNEVTIPDPDLKNIIVEFTSTQKKPNENISLSISHVSKFKQMLLKQQSNHLHDAVIALQNGEKITIRECKNVFYNIGQVYHEETDSYSDSIAKYHAIIWVNVENESCAILKDKKENYYVFTLDKYLIKPNIFLNLANGLTNIEAMPLNGDIIVDRIITNDKLQLVPEKNLFVTDTIP